jgi:hypothetical protein
MVQIDIGSQQLAILVGEQEATTLIYETLFSESSPQGA